MPKKIKITKQMQREFWKHNLNPITGCYPEKITSKNNAIEMQEKNKNIMRNIITTLLLLIGIFTTEVATAQERYAISAYQDFKLAFVGDNKGNDAFTLDAIVLFEYQLKQLNYGYYSVAFSYEHSPLKGGNYDRVSFHVSYTINTFVLEDLEASIDLNLTWIDRWRKTFRTLGSNWSLKYNLSEHLQANAMLQWVRRPDKHYKYKKNAKYTIDALRLDASSFIGFTYKF